MRSFRNELHATRQDIVRIGRTLRLDAETPDQRLNVHRPSVVDDLRIAGVGHHTRIM